MATPASFATCLSYSKYHAINLDIGHFTAAGFDAVAFLTSEPRAHHQPPHQGPEDADQGGANVPWGQGDAPIKEVLQLLSEEKWDIPAHIEFDYRPADRWSPKCTTCYELLPEGRAGDMR